MSRFGRKPKRAEVVWTPELAYAVGLMVTDGCLSGDGRHIIFVSKDREQLRNLVRAFGIKKVKVGYTVSGYTGKKTPRVQFGDVTLWRFLCGIGLMPNKTKVIADIRVPDELFFDFLRGHFDGDGSFFSYWDPRWKSSYLFYTSFVSASKKHIRWLREKIRQHTGVLGHVTRDKKKSAIQLKYAKRDSLTILRNLYHGRKVMCLSRKRLKIEKALRIIGERLSEHQEAT